jgi:hypothetical protein
MGGHRVAPAYPFRLVMGPNGNQISGVENPGAGGRPVRHGWRGNVLDSTPTAAPAPAVPAGTQTRQLNWVVTLIVSILVGSLGVDRFMMGQVGLGILKLITLGGCGIWWLIDVILIATKHQFAGVAWVE